jgi:hypothetical protein
MSILPLPLPLKILATARLVVGASSWLLPYHASRVFALLTLPPQTTIAMRLFGVRDAMLGALLLTAGTEAERSRIVLAGLVVDGIDVLSSLVGFGMGEQEPEVAGMVGVGAAILVGLGLMGRSG